MQNRFARPCQILNFSHGETFTHVLLFPTPGDIQGTHFFILLKHIKHSQPFSYSTSDPGCVFECSLPKLLTTLKN